MKSEEVMRILENAIRIGKGVIRYGSVASYIPELAKADKNKLGICLYTIDGNQFETGNTEDRFTIQSISKVMALCLALETFGAEFVFDHVGVEPSGEAFNSLVELDNRSNRPFNPMINSCASRHLRLKYSFVYCNLRIFTYVLHILLHIFDGIMVH